jgi:hypothetical protein
VSTFTPEQEFIVRWGYAAGIPTVEIGRIIGKTKNAVIGRARRLGLRAAVLDTSLWNPKEDNELVQSYLAGAPLADISRRVGRSEQAVCHRLTRLGIERTRRPDVTLYWQRRLAARAA